MLSHEVTQFARVLVGALDDLKAFREGIAALSNANDALMPHIVGIGEGGGRMTDGAQQMHSLFANTQRTTSTINPRRFYADLEKLLSSLRRVQQLVVSDSQCLELLIEQIERFSTSFDAFLSKPNGSNAAPLLFDASLVERSLRVFTSTLTFIVDCLETRPRLGSEADSLSLSLPVTTDLRDFSQRLASVAAMYSVLCDLLGVSERDQPLTIAKVESGSLWLKVFGDSKALGLMAGFINSATAFVYRNYTNEGKVTTIPKKIESLDAVLDFSKRLKESGVNTEAIEEQLSDAALALSRHLTVLLSDQPSVIINDQRISLSDEIARREVESQRIPKLENVTVPKLAGPSKHNSD